MKIKTAKWVAPMLAYFWKNKKTILERAKELAVEFGGYEKYELDFDYPDYGGLPKSISNKLSSDVVDLIQEQLIDWLVGSRTEKSFYQTALSALTRETLVV